MGFNESSKIWYDGEMVAWKEATVHVNSHVIHYGSRMIHKHPHPL